MTTFETLAVVFAVYAVVFVAHRATRVSGAGEDSLARADADAAASESVQAL